MTRRQALATAAGAALPPTAPARARVINCAEHVWVINNPKFPIDPALATCPTNLPDHDYSGEWLLDEMKRYNTDHTVISHVCYYGRDNRYTSYCVRKWPDKFAGFGLLVGYRLYPPNDRNNAARLEKLVKEDGLIGLRLSPIYDRDVVWLNDPVCYPLWKKAEELKCVFHIFLAPHQVKQAGDMAARFPGVNVVIDHLAMIDIAAPDSAGFGPLLDLARHPNVYIRTTLHNPSKTRMMPYRDVWPFLRRLYDRYGSRRMLWANFFEYTIMKDVIPFFTAEDREWIMGRTAQGIYRFA